ncbi:17305_t:CDS:1 [Gigaspora margarita]|uniref:17305_t:CDS:1 n=1 Tax=Gigaspora margarita TaxID=4874 RepID=A0ABN7WGI4_GIGMA|nr:17305_t:CDS:1 [Gigaspora margarita]
MPKQSNAKGIRKYRISKGFTIIGAEMKAITIFEEIYENSKKIIHAGRANVTFQDSDKKVYATFELKNVIYYKSDRSLKAEEGITKFKKTEGKMKNLTLEFDSSKCPVFKMSRAQSLSRTLEK